MTLRITNLPDGAYYKVIEFEEASSNHLLHGFETTVTDNNGVDQATGPKGAGGETTTRAAGTTYTSGDGVVTEVSGISAATTQKVVFNNRFTPDPIQLSIPTGLITKHLTGDTSLSLDEHAFRFGVYEADGFSVDSSTGEVSGTLVATGLNLADNWDALEGDGGSVVTDDRATNRIADVEWTNEDSVTYVRTIDALNYNADNPTVLESVLIGATTYNVKTDATAGTQTITIEGFDYTVDTETMKVTNTRKGLFYALPTPTGQPKSYKIVEFSADDQVPDGNAINGVTYDGNTYDLQVTVTSSNGELVASYEVYRGSTRLYASSQPLTRDIQVTYNNIYNPNGVNSSPTDVLPVDQGIVFEKSLLGRSLHAEEFSYAMYERDDWDEETHAPKPNTQPVAHGVTGNGSNEDLEAIDRIMIDRVPFTESGDFEFVIVEEGTDGANGLYFDDSELLATAHVTNNVAAAQLEVDWEISLLYGGSENSLINAGAKRVRTENDSFTTGAEKYTFDNEYVPAPDTTEGTTITKSLSGRDWITRDSFQIAVDVPAGAPLLDFAQMAAEYKVDVVGEPSVVENRDAQDELVSTTYTYTLMPHEGTSTPNIATFKPGVRTVDVSYFEDVPEQMYTDPVTQVESLLRRTSWVYTIREVQPTGAGVTTDDQDRAVKEGVTYDAHSATVTVTAVDNLNGAITTTSVVSGETAFTNTYEATGTIALSAKKTLENDIHKQLRYNLGKEFAKYGKPEFESICADYLAHKEVFTQGTGLDIYAKGKYAALEPKVRAIAESDNGKRKNSNAKKAKKILGIKDEAEAE